MARWASDGGITGPTWNVLDFDMTAERKGLLEQKKGREWSQKEPAGCRGNPKGNLKTGQWTYKKVLFRKRRDEK